MTQKIDLKIGDCLEVLKTLKDNSVDSVVTDPPAGIGFMGKSWDSDKGGKSQWIAWLTEVMSEVKRVLKPGAHGLIWALPRTSHWTAHAIEDAGFEIRDVITHVFGTGFPKSLDVSKAIDKAAGAEREVVGANPNKREAHVVGGRGFDKDLGGEKLESMVITSPSTNEAKQWQGYGTALKPASEHWILVRKRDIIVECEEIVLSAIPNTQLTMLGLKEAEELLVHTLVASNLSQEQKEKTLAVGRVVNGLETTAMSALAKAVKSIDLSIVSSWKNISDDDFKMVRTYITAMATDRITDLRILNSCQSAHTLNFTPKSEHYILCRKPLSEKTVVANVLKHGCGGINIDASRVSMSQSCKDEIRAKANKSHGLANSFQGIESLQIKSTKDKFADLPLDKGRFPANFILSHNPDCKEECSEAIYFDVALANEVACALIEKEFQGSQGDCLSYRRFYGELFRLVSENAQCVFPSPADVHAFFCYILNPLAHNQKSLEFFHLSSLGDLVRYYNSENTLMNKSFSTAYLDETLSDKLHSGWIQAFLENPNNTSSGNIDEAYSREKSDRIVCSAEKLKRLYFLNTCLASDLNQCFTRVVCSVKELDSQSGTSPQKTARTGVRGGSNPAHMSRDKGDNEHQKSEGYWPADPGGGSSRFFYCAKASKSDRNDGLDGMPLKTGGAYGSFEGDGRGRQTEHTPTQNHHPTVKSTKLMSYLITMITPPNGVVLDPFMGSGSTGCAAIKSGFGFIGIEKEADYFEISKRRIESI